MQNRQPIVFLDVDGVINDLGALKIMKTEIECLKESEKDPQNPYTVNGVAHEINLMWATANYGANISAFWPLAIPTYMPELIGELVSSCKVVWLTTWADDANSIGRHALKIKKLNVVKGKLTSTKEDDLVAWVHRHDVKDRELWWIEDFENAKNTQKTLNALKLPNVKLVDTTISTKGQKVPGVLERGHLKKLGVSQTPLNST